jgi:hypothetical protein
VKKKPKVYVLPGAFDVKHGYCAKVVALDDFEDLKFENDQQRCELVALRAAVKKLPNADTVFADAAKLSKAFK